MWEHMTEQQYQHEVIVPDKGFPFKLFLFEGHSGKYIREKHWHRSIEIFAVQEGELDFILDTTHYHLGEGEFIIVNSNEVHAIHANRPNHTIVLQIPLNQFASYFTGEQFIWFSHSERTYDEQVACLIFRMYKVYRMQTDVGVYRVDVEGGFYSLFPNLAFVDLTDLGKTFGQCFRADLSGVSVINFIVVLLSFLFVDIFDTLGTLVGVATKADMLDSDGKLPRIKQALLADAIATSAGAIIGTSTTTTYVESSAGVAAGGRTGLSSVVTGLLFLVSIFFAPIFTAIPGFATAPALIFVGFLMVSSVIKIDFSDLTEAVPAYLCMLAMPLMYSIAEGIAMGVVSYVVINLLCGKAKKITPLMYVLAVLFICKYIFL